MTYTLTLTEQDLAVLNQIVVQTHAPFAIVSAFNVRINEQIAAQRNKQ